MKNYLVTGGAGFIGSAIARTLLARGDRVTIVDNISTGFTENVPEGAEFIRSDCHDPAVYSELDGSSFDAILHIAAQSSGEISFEDPVYDLRANTESTLRLLQFALSSGCKRFIFASTMSVYGQPETDAPVNEGHACSPASFYAVGKIASESYLRLYEKYGIRSTALRLFNVYGAGQNMDNLRQGMVSIFLAQMIKNKKIIVKGSLDRFRDFVYIDDVVKSFLLSIDDPRTINGIFNIGTGIKTSVRELLSILLDLYKEDVPVIIEGNTPGDVNGIVADIDLFNKTTGFVPETSLKDGIEKMLQWASQR